MRKWQIQIGFIETDEKERNERYELMLDLISAIKTHLLSAPHFIQSGLIFDGDETGVFPPDHPKNKQI